MTRTTPLPQPHELEAHRTEALRAAVAAGSVPEETREIARLRADETRATLEAAAEHGNRYARNVLACINDDCTIKDLATLAARWNALYERLSPSHPDRIFWLCPSSWRAMQHATSNGIVLAKQLAMAEGVVLA